MNLLLWKKDGEKLNLGISWKKYLTKFGNFPVAININEDKWKVAILLQFGGDYIRDIIDNVLPKVEGYDATVVYLRSITNRCNFENEDKHIKAQLILGTHSQNLRKFCFTNQAVSLERLVSRGKLLEEVDEQTGVAEDSKKYSLNQKPREKRTIAANTA